MGKLVYHGTPSWEALSVLRSGELLSPWYQTVRRCEKKSRESLEPVFEQRGVESVEELALSLTSGNYPERELECRVKAVSVTDDFSLAKAYAETRDNAVGVVFGLDDKVVSGLEGDWIFFVPKFISLGDVLKEVHLVNGTEVDPRIEAYCRTLYGVDPIRGD